MRRIKIIYLLLFQAILFLPLAGVCQNYGNANLLFSVNEDSKLCFDSGEIREWNGYYNTFRNMNGSKTIVPVFSILPDKQSSLIVSVINKRLKSRLVEFRIAGDPKARLIAQVLPGKRFNLILPPRKQNYTLEVVYNGEVLIGELDVRVYPERRENVIVVPVMPCSIDTVELKNYINRIYSPTNIRFNLTVDSRFDAGSFESISEFNSPSLEYRQYTSQMLELRDAYFNQFPNYNRNAHYVFLLSGFKNSSIKEYVVRGKSLGFIATQSVDSLFYRSFGRVLAIGMGELNVSWESGGPSKNSTSNLFDGNGGITMNVHQWDELSSSPQSYSYYDDYEQVSVDNGRVAYFFWEEDEKGNIRLWDNDLMSSIRHPFKRNYQSYHLNIDDFLFETRFTVWNRNICGWHILLIICGITMAALLKKTLDKVIDSQFQRRLFLKFVVRLFGMALGIGTLMIGFKFIDSGYKRFVVKSGPVKELKGMNEFQAIREVKRNKKMQGRIEKNLCSQVLVHRKNKWIKSKRKSVLYFNVTVKNDKLLNCKFDHDSEYLIVKGEKYKSKSASHYMVFTFRNEKGKVIRQEAYNHRGNEITSLFRLADPAKRILLFVNGYRSAATSSNWSDAVSDIENKGLQLPSSTNLIYTFDRFRYWFWNGFDSQFRDRINPADTYYADGNFSISTSNHRNIKSFVTLMTTYPKRCANEYRHTCHHTSSKAKWLSMFKSDYTIDLLRMRSNRRGFKTRMENGRIAGRNLYQMLNEVPNNSKNDTLFIVAHSMGYAYALGMIEELRGKIKFGGFYIFAPENAGAGRVELSEWPELWQYGANFNNGEADAPCTQDGIAPQTAAKGVKNKNRIYIPKKLYAKRGFKDSHFIGLYTYLFEIAPGKKGFVQQH
jgi:hypothetical protein